MTIRYKPLGRAQAGVKGGGQRRYYAVATGRNLVDLRRVAEIISIVQRLPVPTSMLY